MTPAPDAFGPDAALDAPPLTSTASAGAVPRAGDPPASPDTPDVTSAEGLRQSVPSAPPHEIPAMRPYEPPAPAPVANLTTDFLALASVLGTGLARVDSQGTVWAMNEAGAELLEALGSAYGAPAPAPVIDALIGARAGRGACVVDAPITASEARYVAVAAVASNGGGLIALRDHTEEKLLQERLLQSEKMASVGQLVSGVAHELNNPLTGVMGFAQLLLARELDYTARAQVQTIYGEAERAAKIVQNLLSFARRRRPAKEMSDMNSLLQRVLELRSYEFTIRNISLDMTLDTRLPLVWADPDQVQQVFFNVIKNAEQAMIDSHGGGRLTVTTQSRPDGVRVSIADSGPPIPAEVQRRIFDPFFTTKEPGEGTGLGLTICYGIVEEHGGRIWTENPAAGGAVFHIELPVGRQDEQEARESKPDSVARIVSAAPSRRVLVVDDEESIRLLLYDILRLDDHSVEVARSGIEALDRVRSQDFDVIITDMKMPGMDGASFYREVRERDPGLARRIVFITGDTVSADTRAFLQRVANPVLAKPFKIGPLRDAIEGILRQTHSSYTTAPIE